MLKYSATLSSAVEFAEAGKLDSWIHLYLNAEGHNLPFSDGLKLCERYFIAPSLFPVSMFERCTGPEPGMEYPVGKEEFETHVGEMEEAITKDPDMPPLIVQFYDGKFKLNDGNHRHKAYENLGIESVWTIVWITNESEYTDFLLKYGDYVKDKITIRR